MRLVHRRPVIDLGPKPDQEAVFTARVSVGGRGQLFWPRPQAPAPLEKFAREFPIENLRFVKADPDLLPDHCRVRTKYCPQTARISA